MQSGKVRILVLHGWAISAKNRDKWRDFLDLLEENGQEVEFLLLPGLSKPLKEPWNMSDFVSWLLKKVDEQPKNKSLVLLGHSFGGHISLKFAAQHQEKLAGLVLIDSSGLRDHSFKSRFKRSFFKVLAKIGKSLTSSNLARHALYKLARERDYLQADPVLRQTMANILNQEVSDDLDKISLPTQIIWGSEDKVTPVFLGEKIRAGLKNSKLSLVEGARHSPQFTNSKEVANLVSEFIKTI